MSVSSEGVLLITGASGELGHSVLQALSQCKHTNRQRFLILMRDFGGFCMEQRTKILLQLAGVGDDDRFQAIEGDITDPLVITSPEERAEIVEQLTGILHIAADTSFSKLLEPMRRVNVQGTQHIINSARQAGGVPVGHVSSLYVSGGHSGAIDEARLPQAPLFVNAYEQSKWEAEELILDSDVPACIFRCSLMPSKSDGIVQRFSAFHLLAALYQQNLVGFVPGLPECPLEIMSTDDTARVIVKLFMEFFSDGRVFNIGQAGKAPRIEEVTKRVQEVFARSHMGKGKRIGLPEFVSPALFDSLRDSARATKNMRLIRAMALTQSFMPQLLYPKRFSNAAVAAHVCVESFTDPLTVIERSIDYCINTQWLLSLGFDGGHSEISYGEIDRLIMRYVSQKLISNHFAGHIALGMDLTPHLSHQQLCDIARFTELVSGSEVQDIAVWSEQGMSCNDLFEFSRKVLA